MKAWRDAVPVGTHSGIDGPVSVTPARARRWATQLKAIRRAGNKIPVPWFTDSTETTADDSACLAARFNAGYLEDAEFDEKRGMLRFLVDVPAAELDSAGNLVHEVQRPDGTKAKEGIGELRLGFANWKDGTGKLWQDVIINASLVPQGTALAALSTTGKATRSGRISLSTLIDSPTNGGRTMAKTNERLDRIKASLARCGIKVPEDTTDDNFQERLDLALGAHEHAKDHFAQQKLQMSTKAKRVTAGMTEATCEAILSRNGMPAHKTGARLATTGGKRTQADQSENILRRNGLAL